MHYLLRKQTLIILTLFLCGMQAQAQIGKKPIYREEREYKPFYFGLSLGSASATLHPSKSMYFLENDSVLVAEPGKSPGYSVRLMGTARLSNRFEFRFNPGLVLGIDRSITYTLGSKQLYEETVTQQSIQSNIATFPFHFKFNSDRIHNFKVYMLAGVKYDIDLASNAGSRNAEDMVKLNQTDFGAELGIGFNFFLPFVTVTPEIKFSNGFRDLHVRDPNLKYSNVLDNLYSRMVFFTLHLEE